MVLKNGEWNYLCLYPALFVFLFDSDVSARDGFVHSDDGGKVSVKQVNFVVVVVADQDYPIIFGDGRYSGE